MLQMLWNFVIGTPSVVVIVAIAAFIATVKGTMWVTGVNTRLNVLGDTQDKISAELKDFRDEVKAEFKEIRADIKEQLSQITGQMTEMRVEITQMNGEINQIKGHLGMGLGQPPQATQANLSASKSPLVLNEKGQSILKRMNAEGVNATDFARKYVEGVGIPKSADKLQIQEMSFNYASSRLMVDANAEDRQKLRDYSFDSGHPIPDVLTVIGFEMRDVMLEERDPEAFKAVKKGLKSSKATGSRKARTRTAAKKKATKAS